MFQLLMSQGVYHAELKGYLLTY